MSMLGERQTEGRCLVNVEVGQGFPDPPQGNLGVDGEKSLDVASLTIHDLAKPCNGVLLQNWALK